MDKCRNCQPHFDWSSRRRIVRPALSSPNFDAAFARLFYPLQTLLVRGAVFWVKDLIRRINGESTFSNLRGYQTATFIRGGAR